MTKEECTIDFVLQKLGYRLQKRTGGGYWLSDESGMERVEGLRWGNTDVLSLVQVSAWIEDLLPSDSSDNEFYIIILKGVKKMTEGQLERILNKNGFKLHRKNDGFWISDLANNFRVCGLEHGDFDTMTLEQVETFVRERCE